MWWREGDFFGGGGWIEVNLCRYDSIFVELMFDFAKNSIR